MNRNTKKLKRINTKSTEKVSTAQKRIRNANEKRRRDLFSQLINNLGEVISTNQSNKLSKNSILRHTVAFLQQHKHILTNELNLDLSPKSTLKSDIINFFWKPSGDIVNNDEWFQIAIESMQCFLLIAKDDLPENKIVYVSKNINNYLGYSQDEIINNSLFKFISLSNHEQLTNYLKNNHQVLKKCDVDWKQSINDSYEQCTIIGAFRQVHENERYFLSIVKINSLDKTSILNRDFISQEFIVHINNSGRFIFINPKCEEYLGYNSYELLGQTFFDFVHPDDLPILTKAHHIWKSNGNGKSDPYRFLTKGQQWIFLQTYSQVHINSWTGKAEHYICTTTILQCSTDSLKNQLSQSLIDNSTMEYPSAGATTMPLTIDIEDKNPSQNEITSFLTHLNNENYRQIIREKLVKLQKEKEIEIRVRQDEIEVIQDILQFINQYQPNNQPKTIPTEDFLLNFIDTNNDLTLFNSPLSRSIEDYSMQTTSSNDPLLSLFSPPSVTFNLSSPITPFINNDQLQDINYLPATNSSTDENNFL